MTRSHYIFVWLSSLALSAAVFATALSLVFSRPALDVEITAAETERPAPEAVILGSSVVGYAFPPFLDQAAVPWSSATERRRYDAVSDRLLLGMVAHALRKQASTILVEAGPLVRLPRAKKGKLGASVAQYSKIARTGIEEIAGVLPAQMERSKLNQIMNTDKAGFNVFVPNEIPVYRHLRSAITRELAARWLAAASDPNVDIVLLGFPRAQSSVRYYMSDQNLLRQAERELAQKAHLPFFEPDVFWEDKYFLDRSHFNDLGQERYSAELRAWWDTR